MAFQAPPILHADVPALDVACGLLGVGRSSRLRRHLQTELGLVGDVRAGVVAYRDVGIVTVSAHVVGHDVDRVVEGVFEQIERLRAQPVLAGELEKMLRRLEAGYVLEHETAGSIAGGIGLFETLGDYRYFEDYVDRLAAVTPNDVLRVARDHLSPAVARVVTYGPEAAGLPVGDRSREIARLAERVRDAAPAVVAERPSVWEPSKAFERPVLLAERGASACSRELLGSGAVLVVSEARALPVASIAVALRGGFVDEPDDLAGVTYLTQKLTLRGAGGRSADEVADAIEGLGSAIAMAIDRDGFGYGMTLLSEHLPEGLGILGDVLAEPGLPADQLERVRREVQTEIRQLTDHPLRRALLLVLPLAFPGHRYGRPLRGTSAGVARIARSDVEGWHARIFDAGNLIVSAVGDVDRGAAREAVERLGERLRGGERSAPVGPVVDPPSGQSDVAHGRAAQSTIAVALRGPRAGASDDVAVRVLCRACSMMGGRLWRALRERPPHAYAVGASSIALRSGGLIFAHATAPVGQEDAAVEALAGELSRLATGGLAREELERAKRHLVGMLALSMERGAARAASYAMAEATGPGCEYVDRMPDLVRSTTGRDVSSAAERYLGAGSGRATVILRGVTAD
jgi:zinc protease